MKTKFGLKRQILSIILCLTLLLACVPFSSLTAYAADAELSDDIVILYTNDVHTYIDDTLSYDVIAAVKKDLQKEYQYVILADAGDHIQGTAYGSLDKGESIIKMMNAAGYDVATLGNHEFDYNMQGCMNAIEWADFPYISCNFYQEADGVRGETVLDSYKLFECGDETIAFVGITTPETFSKSTPTYFQDGNGNFIYGISGGDDGLELQQDVQKAIDGAKAAGATKVIALGHLGVDPSSTPWTSEETIAGVSGLDAFIDGHSHTVMESNEVLDKDGNSVLLTQTGEYFNRIGMMVIDSESGEITTDFIECTGDEENGYKLTSDLYGGTEFIYDEAVKALKEDWLNTIEERLGQKIGYAEVTFDNYDSDGNRLVRVQETNSGDFVADALYYLFDNMDLDVDIAVMNGGGVRNQAITGDITYKTCKDINPFGNVACLQTVTGQQILDMLEWGARYVGEAENGALLHVSGVTYKINTAIENTTQADDMDVWVGGPSEYRVHDVMVYNKDTDEWDELDLDAEYNLAGYNYTLRDLGGGYAMLNDAVNVLDYVMEDYMVLANYVCGFEDGIIKADNSPLLAKYPGLAIDYSDINGSGRIEAVSDYGIWVGGVKVTEDNAEDVFEDGKVSYDAETNTLTLNGYVYEGEGYEYGFTEFDDVKQSYTAAIYSERSINIRLEGTSTLKNTNLFGEGVFAADSAAFIGDGNLNVFANSGILADGNVTINGSTIYMITEQVGVIAASGGMDVINGAVLLIDTDGIGVYAGGDVTITDSKANVAAGSSGIYAYNGTVSINSTKVGIAAYSPSLDGTKVSVETDGGYSIFALKGLMIDEKLTISSPESAEVRNVTEGAFTYSTIVVGETAAKSFVIEPLGYTVSIKGLSYSRAALVPVGNSLNETYCEKYGVEDFSEMLNTQKDGYSFGGWYTDEACTDGNEYNFNSPVTGNVTIYAKWIPVSKPSDGSQSGATGGGTEESKPSDDSQTGTTGGDTGNSGSTTTDSVLTGDNSGMELWFALMIISGSAILGLMLAEGKRKTIK